ncbi:hypothetical protein G7Y89_g8563 [Cudoniella acicularis]|uniref:Prolyl 4-hydroxylase alpha subunit domain-containing protein n=1 Tax=Cudoniella acicularis TaxID=354080 RepID=A0A8H4RK18_9HELO|nr:hypothetical protein G7Y89_g8563 [Cudoniella acicularis]
MSRKTILQKVRSSARKLVNYGETESEKEFEWPKVVKTKYTSLDVDIPSDFLAPLPDPSKITVKQIDFVECGLPEYKERYAVVLDNVLNEQECKEVIHLAEKSAGAHKEEEEGEDGEPVKPIENNGWRPAMVNAGQDHEFLSLDYRNSDRIIWDNRDMVHRIWLRIQQAEGMKEYFSALEGKKYMSVIESGGVKRGERWVITEQGPNERMRFLKYGAGQFFRRHCDGMYETPDGSERSYYTMHLYLNDSAQALGEPIDLDAADPTIASKNPAVDPRTELLRGGATTFHANYSDERTDVDPKIGRVLIFQQKGLLHSGDDVTAGIKYTMRSDLMYTIDARDDEIRSEEDVFSR